MKKNRNDLLEDLKKYKKVNHRDYLDKPFEIQPYQKQMKLSQARLNFKIKSFMTPTVKFDFLNEEKFRLENYKCWHCSSVDSQAHMKSLEMEKTLKMMMN